MQSINRVAVAASRQGASGPVYDVVQLSFLGVFVITEAKSFVTYLNYNQQPRLFFQATERRSDFPDPTGSRSTEGRERERAAASCALSRPPFHLLRLFYVSNGCSGEFISIFSFFFSFHLFLLLLLPIYLFLHGFASIQFITSETLYDNSVYFII